MPLKIGLRVDLETGMRVASKVGNIPSKFGHASPFASRIIRYATDGQTDGRTKATLIAPFLRAGACVYAVSVQTHRQTDTSPSLNLALAHS